MEDGMMHPAFLYELGLLSLIAHSFIGGIALTVSAFIHFDSGRLMPPIS